MKNILLILFLIVISCTVNKHKEKEKSVISEKTESNTAENQKVVETSNLDKAKTDSTILESHFNIDRSKAATLQNFQLKSNGKCTDPGIIRYVQFTDVLGNKTSIPVNDNTDLNFESESELQKENENLKAQLSKVTKENETLKREKESVTAKKAAIKSDIKVNNRKTDVKTEKQSFWAFIIVGLISILLWELLKQAIKKYFFK